MKKRKMLAVLALSAFVALGGCIEKSGSVGSQSDTGEVTGKVIAEVNNQKITLDMLNQRAKQLSMMYGEYYVQPEGKLEVLDDMVNDALLMQEVKKRGLENNPELSAQIRDYQVQMEQQMKQYRDHLLKSKLVEMTVPPAREIDDVEAEKYYNDNKKSFTEKTKVWARHILVKTKEDADNILAELKKGGDFTKLAAEKSLDEPTAKDGGNLGALEEGMMYPEMDKVIFSMAIGETAVIPLKSGFYKGFYSVIRVDKKVEGTLKPFAEIKDQVKERISQEEIRKSYQAFVEQLREKYKVVTYPDKIAASIADFTHPPMTGGKVDAGGVPNDDVHRDMSAVEKKND